MTGQHSSVFVCLLGMDTRTKEIPTKGSHEVSEETDVYKHDTPKWRKYYQKVRKNIRFPRYYKKALNW